MQTGHWLITREGAPVLTLDDPALVQEFVLAHPDDADLIDVWRVPNGNGTWEAYRVTDSLAVAWAHDYSFADGFRPDEYLRNYPPFVIAHCRDVLIAKRNADRAAAWNRAA